MCKCVYPKCYRLLPEEAREYMSVCGTIFCSKECAIEVNKYFDQERILEQDLKHVVPEELLIMWELAK